MTKKNKMLTAKIDNFFTIIDSLPNDPKILKPLHDALTYKLKTTKEPIVKEMLESALERISEKQS